MALLVWRLYMLQLKIWIPGAPGVFVKAGSRALASCTKIENLHVMTW